MTFRHGLPPVLAALLAAPMLATPTPAQGTWNPRRCLVDTLSAAPAATTTVDTVAPGISYRCIVDRRGPWVMHVVTVDLRARDLAIDAERALGAFHGRQRVSGIARRIGAAGGTPLVGINADFFDLKTGEIENNHVVHGDWVKGAVVSDSPHDEFDNAHTQFAIDARGRPLIGRFELHGTAMAGRTALDLVGINYRPARRPGLVLFNPWYGPRTPTDTSDRVGGARPRDPDPSVPGARGDSAPPRSVPELRADSARRLASQATREALEVSLRRIGRRADTVLYRAQRRSTLVAGGATLIPAQGAVLSATGHEAVAFARVIAREGAVVKVVSRLGAWPIAPRAVVGGWPRVLTGGVNVGTRSDSAEGTFPRFSSARHPRSALAITRDSSTLMMVVVDGRRPWSVGMSLAELGDALAALGAWEGMNLDGGGSATLWIRGTVVNHPSDPSGERAVGNALFVVGKRRGGR